VFVVRGEPAPRGSGKEQKKSPFYFERLWGHRRGGWGGLNEGYSTVKSGDSKTKWGENAPGAEKAPKGSGLEVGEGKACSRD